MGEMVSAISPRDRRLRKAGPRARKAKHGRDRSIVPTTSLAARPGYARRQPPPFLPSAYAPPGRHVGDMCK